MKLNVGSSDRIIRIAAGIILIALFFILDGGLRYIGLLGIVILLTAAFNYCPLYTVLGMSTRKATSDNDTRS
ncbi:DUF2892 domain-containing protein [bacterium]|nr:DUF2892 domain-containing protein [bacterium]